MELFLILGTMGDSKKHFLIIDCDPNRKSRQNGMISALQSFGIVYRYASGDDTLESDQELPGIWEPAVLADNIIFDLVLIHGGDAEYKNKFPHKKRIWYSGSDGYDPRGVLGEEQIIRGILTGEQALTLEEAKALIDYIDQKTSSPSFLQVAVYLDERYYQLILNELLLPSTSKDFWDNIWQNYNQLFDKNYQEQWQVLQRTVKELIPTNVDLGKNAAYQQAVRSLSHAIFD